MITQKDVARLAGVSVSTVSRVLNESSLVDEKTKQIVESAIKKLNYKPNLVAYGLRAKSSKLVGLILPEMNHYTYASFAQFVEGSCMEKGYSMLLGLHHNECELEKSLVDEFQRRNVDGLILCLAIDEQNLSNNLMEYISVPTVMYERTFNNNRMGGIRFDNYKAGKMAAKYLAGLNHKNIACTVGPMGMHYVQDRFFGFRDELTVQGIEIKKQNVLECDFNYRVPNFVSGEDAARAFLDGRSDRDIPTAIWAHNDNVASGVIKELHRRKIKIPEEISVMGVDNIGLTDMIYPSLTTIGQPLKNMAEKSVEMIMEEIELGEEYKADIVIMEPELIIRESTGKCRS
ncbi:LacI family transcriptional regulator [Lacrimispora sp. NSJ-141]|uniref:LacI family transcriptional regulator n=1 Tax=Lientehia hominis TaxID=2897778 RepID=A0AAP2RL02_9FIRM|nr:LacI family DNA-binding transcriptional regulator [Lientehia hominis]MCD2493564.1 LacI family transcriptional regulator [Lientehia hominis]